MSTASDTDLKAEPAAASTLNAVNTSALPHVRFGHDKRIQEVERIMQTSRVRTISIEDPKGAR